MNLKGKRTALQKCECFVPDFLSYDPSAEKNCDEPAVAVWEWDGEKMFVCEKHDEVVSLNEEMEGHEIAEEEPDPAIDEDELANFSDEHKE